MKVCRLGSSWMKLYVLTVDFSDLGGLGARLWGFGYKHVLRSRGSDFRLRARESCLAFQIHGAQIKGPARLRLFQKSAYWGFHVALWDGQLFRALYFAVLSDAPRVQACDSLEVNLPTDASRPGLESFFALA